MAIDLLSDAAGRVWLINSVCQGPLLRVGVLCVAPHTSKGPHRVCSPDGSIAYEVELPGETVDKRHSSAGYVVLLPAKPETKPTTPQ